LDAPCELFAISQIPQILIPREPCHLEQKANKKETTN
jgi:hypothetical protein